MDSCNGNLQQFSMDGCPKKRELVIAAPRYSCSQQVKIVPARPYHVRPAPYNHCFSVVEYNSQTGIQCLAGCTGTTAQKLVSRFTPL